MFSPKFEMFGPPVQFEAKNPSEALIETNAQSLLLGQNSFYKIQHKILLSINNDFLRRLFSFPLSVGVKWFIIRFIVFSVVEAMIKNFQWILSSFRMENSSTII